MRVRTFSPLDRQKPIFEVCNDGGQPVFDISMSDAGFFEIGFHGAIANQVLLLDDFQEALREAISLALAADSN